MAVRIPEPAYEPLSAYLLASEAERENLQRSILAAKPAMDLTGLLVNAFGADFTPAHEDLAGLFFNLAAAAHEHSLGRSAFIEDFVSAVKTDAKVKKPEHPNWQRIHDSISELLADASPVVRTWSARSISIEGANVFYAARIISDLRPVFADKPEELPDLVAIIHTLRIRHRNATGATSRFVALLDLEDLHALKKTVERAIAKHAAMEGLAAKAGMAVAEPGERKA